MQLISGKTFSLSLALINNNFNIWINIMCTAFGMAVFLNIDLVVFMSLLISGNSRRELETEANTAVKTIHNWCQRYKMTMSPTKRMAIVFGKTLKRKPIIKLGTSTLPVKENTRYLGVILDQKLNFSKHINASLEKAKAQLKRILTLTTRKYNIHPRKFKVYYNAIFLSIVTYAIQIFADEYKKVRNRRKALTVQRAVLRGCTERTQQHQWKACR